MYGMTYYLGAYYWLLIPAILFTMFAQFKVQAAFARYSKVRTKKGITGYEAADKILRAASLYNMPINQVEGSLSDNYNPITRSLNLSPDVYGSSTVAAVAVAAHEAGHAIQHSNGYWPLIFRNIIAKPVGIMSSFSWIALILGQFFIIGGESFEIGRMIFDLGILMFSGVVVFHLITLPVELNASARALRLLTSEGILMEDEKSGARSVLSAAALTYLAALASTILTLIRLLLIRGRD